MIKDFIFDKLGEIRRQENTAILLVEPQRGAVHVGGAGIELGAAARAGLLDALALGVGDYFEKTGVFKTIGNACVLTQRRASGQPAVLSGEDLKEGQFSFQLKDADGKALFKDAAEFHTLRVMPPPGMHYTTDILRKFCDVWEEHGSGLIAFHGQSGDIMFQGATTAQVQEAFDAINELGFDLGGAGPAVRTSMSCVGAARCEQSCFDEARAHRQVIVNLDHLQRIEEDKGDAPLLHLRGLRAPVRASRREWADLRELLPAESGRMWCSRLRPARDFPGC